MIVADALRSHAILFLGARPVRPNSPMPGAREGVAPPLWRSEFRNTLAVAVRKGGLSLAQALESVKRAEAAMLELEIPVSSVRVLQIAFESGCSAYDCEYVFLAETLSIPLVTSDKRILSGFPGIAVSLEEFIA